MKLPVSGCHPWNPSEPAAPSGGVSFAVCEQPGSTPGVRPPLGAEGSEKRRRAPRPAGGRSPKPGAARTATVALGLIVLLGFTGCGYRAGAGELYRPGIRTVYVEMFASKEFRRDLEFSLTEAVKKRIGADTPYKLAAREKADTILKGELLEERQAAFAPDFASRLPREKQLTLAVRVEWKDLRSGELLIDQPVLLQSVDYLTPTGETEAFGQQKAIDKLAARIVAQMYDDW
ncbi:hypothetical protein RAS1_42790 [Phycisphaerae bacterium RAS1]|nr:hypothetical protein RAS1_42790 [Phycisphaerae bacterium RAS1]